MNKLLTCDYILGNSDRHYNNFGALRNVNTLKYLGMSSIFDTGASLGIISNEEYKLTLAPFYKDPKKQLKLVSDLSWLDPSKLNGFSEYVEETLKMDDMLVNAYIKTQIDALKERIKDVLEYKSELE